MTLAIATPIRGGTDAALVALGYARFLYYLASQRETVLLEGALTFSADVARARNRLAALVLRELPKVTHVAWIDDDQCFEDAQDGIRVLTEMIATGEHVIGAPYTNKTPPIRWVHQTLPGAQPDARGLLDANLGFGMTITSRACLEKMTAAGRLYRDHPNHHKITNLFGQLYDPTSDDSSEDALLSEDFSFCKRWRELGGRTVVYTRAGVVKHYGGRGWSARDMPGGVLR